MEVSIELYHKGLKAIKEYLKTQKEYMILDGICGDYIDYVVQDEKDTVRFIHCIVVRDCYKDETPILKNRSEIEDEICNWIYDNDIVDCKVVFDILQLRVIEDSNRAMIRYHNNAWGSGEID